MFVHKFIQFWAKSCAFGIADVDDILLI